MNGHDLGHGVHVRELEEGGVEVLSPQVELPWHARQGHFPGTLVRWQGDDWEVVARRSAEIWRLARWPDEETARSQVRLDAGAISALVATTVREQHENRLRTVLMVLAPLVGLAPRRWLCRLARDLAYPARAAAWLSAWLEAGVGVVVGLDTAARAFSGAGFLPPVPVWLILAGLVVGVEGAVRLVVLMTSDQPVGSLLSVPLLLIDRHQPSRVTPMRVRPDRGDGVLELATAERRGDWQLDGWLMVRGKPYRLVAERQEHSRWLYRFERAAGRGDGVTVMRWLPRAGPDPDGSGRAVSSSLVAGLELVAFAFAPAQLQRRWAERHAFPAWVLTVVSAVAEIVGGTANLLGRPPGVLTVIDLLLLLDGSGRVLVAVVRLGPVGSLLGLPWRRWYQRRLEL